VQESGTKNGCGHKTGRGTGGFQILPFFLFQSRVWKPPTVWKPLTYRAAVFDIAGCKTTVIPSVTSRFIRKTARQESSKFCSDLINTSSMKLTKYYCVNCRCSAVTMPIKLSSYMTWSASERVASVEMIELCVAKVLSHMIV